MKLKIICGQLEITPGRPDVNYKKIIDAIEKARSLEADILLLPEMALPGHDTPERKSRGTEVKSTRSITFSR